jgi:hypothetical protein
MNRIRVTAVVNPDPSVELRRLSMVRRDLYGHSPVEIDPDNPAHQNRRDAQRRAYFEFSTNYVDEVRRVLREYGHESSVTVEEVAGPAGEPCLRCGHVAGPVTPPVCPNCEFRDISPCPHCHEEVPRQEYESVAGDLFRCPRCRTRVRLHFNDPLVRSDGSYSEPVVIVEEAIQQQPV